MAILDFQQPDKVIMHKETANYGLFEFSPLERGYGITVGNAMRRILLSSLEGWAITSIRIPSVDHEFSSIKGVLEDVTEIILNLKQVRFKKLIDSNDSEKIFVSIKGKEEFKAGEIARYTNAFEILNPEARHLVKKRLDEIKENNISNFNMISEEFQKILKEEGLNVKIFGREKTPFSIWRKIQKKRTSLEQITDIIGFRVIVDDVSDCYKTLGVFHKKWNCIP